MVIWNFLDNIKRQSFRGHPFSAVNNILPPNLFNWEEQDGCGWKWWERCSFEAFRDKFVREAEQNRALQIRLGQEIANRTRQYFHDYLEDLSADMPSVEQWTEPLSDEVHYRWRPQKDCFYLDENIDDYLRELYEFVRK